jgi:hypothetical protein
MIKAMKTSKVWTVQEAIQAIKNRDKLAILDFGARFPLFSTASYEEILMHLPSSVTVRKIEHVMKLALERELNMLGIEEESDEIKTEIPVAVEQNSEITEDEEEEEEIEEQEEEDQEEEDTEEEYEEELSDEEEELSLEDEDDFEEEQEDEEIAKNNKKAKRSSIVNNTINKNKTKNKVSKKKEEEEEFEEEIKPSKKKPKIIPIKEKKNTNTKPIADDLEDF